MKTSTQLWQIFKQLCRISWKLVKITYYLFEDLFYRAGFGKEGRFTKKLREEFKQNLPPEGWFLILFLFLFF
jgi:hypothetical protein|tara:strand:+ start:428 stop:643 length:216 start_codon:yes stop_codon:yes gene_type:complete